MGVQRKTSYKWHPISGHLFPHKTWENFKNGSKHTQKGAKHSFLVLQSFIRAVVQRHISGHCLGVWATSMPWAKHSCIAVSVLLMQTESIRDTLLGKKRSLGRRRPPCLHYSLLTEKIMWSISSCVDFLTMIGHTLNCELKSVLLFGGIAFA